METVASTSDEVSVVRSFTAVPSRPRRPFEVLALRLAAILGAFFAGLLLPAAVLIAVLGVQRLGMLAVAGMVALAPVVVAAVLTTRRMRRLRIHRVRS